MLLDLIFLFFLINSLVTSGVWPSVSLVLFICRKTGQNSCYQLVMLLLQCRCWRNLTKWCFCHNWICIENKPNASRFHLNLTCFLLGGRGGGGSGFMKSAYLDHSQVSSLVAILTLAEKSWLTAARKSAEPFWGDERGRIRHLPKVAGKAVASRGFFLPLFCLQTFLPWLKTAVWHIKSTPLKKQSSL